MSGRQRFLESVVEDGLAFVEEAQAVRFDQDFQFEPAMMQCMAAGKAEEYPGGIVAGVCLDLSPWRNRR